jgi:hypothetical protein
MADIPRIIDYRSPSYASSAFDWEKWRLTFDSGDEFRRKYLKKFSLREDQTDYDARLDITPIPGFARAALLDIRNAVFQRMRDIVRVGGSKNYQNAVAGLSGGVDRRGSSMNAFIGMKALTDLLVMGKVGVFVDSPALIGPKMSDALGVKPYLYSYQTEDILSYTTRSDAPEEFQAVLLRDMGMQFDANTYLPVASVERYRRLWLEGGQVMAQFYDKDSKEDGGVVALELEKIPFVMVDIGDSLIKGVCQHQIALLNLGSSDVNYALKANFPFYVEQDDGRGAGSHLKPIATEHGTAAAGGQGSADRNIKVGVTQGRTYALKANQPSFINPSPDPLRASMELQKNLKDDIRELVNLAVMTLATRASAESKQVDNQGLEAGLSYIGLVLENAERKIAEYWSAYEEKDESRRLVPTIKYPDRYSLKTDADRVKESSELSNLMQSVPGQTVKREIAKCIVQVLLGGKVPVSTIERINREVDETPYTTSDPTTIIKASEAGLVGERTASLALGFNDGEHLVARTDHAKRIARIAEAQKPAGDPAARGVNDLSADPDAGTKEKEVATDTTLQDTTKKNQRGLGANKET